MNDFSGIWLPAEILLLEDLNLTEVVLLSAIIPLALGRPCTAENKHLAKKAKVSSTTVSLAIKSLSEKGYLYIDAGQKRGNERHIWLYSDGVTLFQNLKDPSLRFLKTPLFQNVKDPLSDSYRPYLKNLKSLFKNFKELNKVESKIENKVPTNQPNAAVENFENGEAKNDDFEAEVFQNEPPVAAAPQLPEVWQRVSDEISSNDMCKIMAMRGVKANNLLDVYPEFSNVLSEFIEGERLKSQVPRWKDDNDMKSNFRDWLKTYLPKKREQIDSKGNGTSIKSFTRKAGFEARTTGLKPPGVPPAPTKGFGKL